MANTTKVTINKPTKAKEEERYVGKFVKHLFELLPLYNISDSDKDNKVISYSADVLKSLGREVIIDDSFNIVSNAESNRAMIAHTDSVLGSIDRKNDLSSYHSFPYQRIRYSNKTRLIINETMARPMGGDDKVGIAAALAMAEIHPETVIWLVANEEVGCKGSRTIKPGKTVELAVQLDRRGSFDIIDRIGGDRIVEEVTMKAALSLIFSERESMSGGSTDVGVLVDRELANCAFNMSCGYFNPHSEKEYIHLDLAVMAAIDGYRIMRLLPSDLCTKPKKNSFGTYTHDHYHNPNHFQKYPKNNASTPIVNEDKWNEMYERNKENSTQVFESKNTLALELSFRPSIYKGVGSYIDQHKSIQTETISSFLESSKASFEEAFKDTEVKAFKLLRAYHYAFSDNSKCKVEITPILVFDNDMLNTIGEKSLEPTIDCKADISKVDLYNLSAPIKCFIIQRYFCDWCRQPNGSNIAICYSTKEEVSKGKYLPGIVCEECWNRFSETILAERDNG